jgi:hypothetical protein
VKTSNLAKNKRSEIVTAMDIKLMIFWHKELILKFGTALMVA